MPLPETLVIQRELLPRGANGFVFLALDTTLRRVVVVKVWLNRGDDSRDKVAQGKAEARKIANLRHPNIAEVFSAGQPAEDIFFLTMEYLDGTTLRGWLQTPDIDFLDRYRVWHDIAKAVKHAHRSGVYHGDLHPGNVILVGRSPKIIDFGTSLFARRRQDSLTRETRLGIELAQMLFHEHTRSALTCEDWYALRPEAALQACYGWAKVLWLEHDLLRKKAMGNGLDDYDCRGAGIKLSITLRYSPLFDLPKLTGWFRSIVEEETHVLGMLDLVRTQFEDVFDPRSERHIHIDTDQTAVTKLGALQNLARRVRSHFKASGPWE